MLADDWRVRPRSDDGEVAKPSVFLECYVNHLGYHRRVLKGGMTQSDLQLVAFSVFCGEWVEWSGT